MANIQIIVAAHKKYRMPSDGIYLPVHVGAEGKQPIPDYTPDNTGDQISAKNKTFCELTGLYWAWKNLDADIIGLDHYRRYMGTLRRIPGKDKYDRLLTAEDIESLLQEHDVILPPKRHYWIETRESQYIHAHHAEDLTCTKHVLLAKYPEYLAAWEWMLGTRSGHICNMFVMTRERFDEYCSWLFDVLFEVEARLDISEYSPKDQRVFGYLGERLLDVWIRTKGLRYVEVPMITVEKQHWVRKGISFIKRKIKPNE